MVAVTRACKQAIGKLIRDSLHFRNMLLRTEEGKRMSDSEFQRAIYEEQMNMIDMLESMPMDKKNSLKDMLTTQFDAVAAEPPLVFGTCRL